MVKIIVNLVSLLSICLVAAGYIPQMSKRIIGGRYARPGERPYQVHLFSYNSFRSRHGRCGGVILAPSTVVSAAHCFRDRQQKNKLNLIVAGHLSFDDIHLSQIRNARSPSQIRHAIQINIHPDYVLNAKGYHQEHNDIAVIKLNKKFDFNQYVNYIALNVGNVPGNLPSFVSGWGEVRPGTAAEINIRKVVFSDRLKIAQYFTIPYEMCVRMDNHYLRPIQPGTLCALNQKTLEGACVGDSGGPLTYNNILIGLVSGGDNGCSKKDTMAYFNDVSRHYQFIIDKAREDVQQIKTATINTAANQPQFNRPSNF